MLQLLKILVSSTLGVCFPEKPHSEIERGREEKGRRVRGDVEIETERYKNNFGVVQGKVFYACMYRCTCVHKYIELRGQSWVLFLGHHSLF